MELENASPVLILLVGILGLVSIGFMIYSAWQYAEKRRWNAGASVALVLVAFVAAFMLWPVYDIVWLTKWALRFFASRSKGAARSSVP